jgi:hypothetical protein
MTTHLSARALRSMFHAAGQPAITLNTYVGEWPDTDERTRSIVDAALGDVPRLCPPGTAARQRRR